MFQKVGSWLSIRSLELSETRSSQALSACWKQDQLAGWAVSCAHGLELNEDDSHHSSGDLWFVSTLLGWLWLGTSPGRDPQAWNTVALVHWILPFGAQAAIRTVRRRDVIAASAQEARQKAGRCAFLGDQRKEGPRQC